MAFEQYAGYYDLLYQDKDYKKEAEYIYSLLQKYAPKAQTLFDLGCGTGRHAELLAQMGDYKIFGVDQSEEMLRFAFSRATSNRNLHFFHGSLQNFSLPNQADAITALFHVMSYQSTDTLVIDALKNIAKHLKPGGIFLFDCWYGPAVLLQRPELRVKRAENERVKVTRIAEPKMRENENIVEVHYDTFAEDKQSGTITEFKEVHVMRHFFLGELQYFLKQSGFVMLESFEFMTGRSLGGGTWGSCFVVKLQEQ